MDKINYRRMYSVYLSDMRALEEKQPNHIPRTAKGVYYAGEQENKNLKIQGGFKQLLQDERTLGTSISHIA